MPSQTNSSIQTGFQLTTASIETQSENSIRPYFSLDVKPQQKAIYASDQFNQTEEGRKNGSITRIQGVKGSTQNRASVWPKVHVSHILMDIHCNSDEIELNCYLDSRELSEYAESTFSRLCCIRKITKWNTDLVDSS